MRVVAVLGYKSKLRDMMKKALLSFVFVIVACIPVHATTCGTFTITGTCYHLANASTSPVGNDSNNGLSTGAPWLTPNHSLNCGDMILAVVSSTYSASQFANGNWGTVTCAAQNNVAWVACATFDGCKIPSLSAGQNGTEITKSYWGVQGFEIDGNAAAGMCFFSGWNNIRNIIFANNVAVGCGLAGVEFGNFNTAGPDYIVAIGNIAYNTATSSSQCGSGFNLFAPIAQDTLPGTHVYFAGNFGWHNINPSVCAGTPPTDGNGMAFDTLDGRAPYGPGIAYTQQVVADNNILVGNGGRGFNIVNNNASGGTSGPFAKIYVRNNTLWGNNIDPNGTQPSYFCAAAVLNATETTIVYRNIFDANAVNGCNGGTTPIYSVSVVSSATTTDRVYTTVGFSAGGTVSNTNSSSGFSYGPSNLFGTDPQFASPSVPGAPSCGSATSVPNCMAAMIANFTPTNTAAAGYGYQAPSTVSVYDSLYPQWLCSVTNLPTGLVTPGCLTGEHQ